MQERSGAMRTEYLEYLLKVVECGSMNKAAKALFCSQPALSSAIKAIEEELGFPVIARTPQGVTPTRNGARIVEEAKVILNTVSGWKQMSLSSEESSTVDVAYRGIISHTHLIHIITQLKSTHPNINLRLHPEVSLLSPSDSSGCRIGIVIRVPQHYDDMVSFVERNNLQVSPLYEDKFVLFMNTAHPLARQDRIYLQDLAGCKLALPNSPTDFPYLEYFDAVGCDYSMQLGDEENIMLAVLKNLAITIRPRILAGNNYYSYIMQGSICSQTIEDCPMPNTFYIITPPSSRLTESEQIVIRAIKDAFTKPILP